MKIPDTKQAINADIARLIRSGRFPNRSQAIAIAFSEAGEGKAGSGHGRGGHRGHKGGKK